MMNKTEEKIEYISLLSRFHVEGLSLDAFSDEDQKISENVLALAISIILRFPDDLPLPKMIPDEEGALLMSWRGRKVSLVMIKDDGTLDIIIDARSDNPIIHEQMPISINKFPEELLQLRRIYEEME